MNTALGVNSLVWASEYPALGIDCHAWGIDCLHGESSVSGCIAKDCVCTCTHETTMGWSIHSVLSKASHACPTVGTKAWDMTCVASGDSRRCYIICSVSPCLVEWLPFSWVCSSRGICLSHHPTLLAGSSSVSVQPIQSVAPQTLRSSS